MMQYEISCLQTNDFQLRWMMEPDSQTTSPTFQYTPESVEIKHCTIYSQLGRLPVARAPGH